MISETRTGTPRRRPKGYSAWRPRSRTREVLEQVQEVLEEYAPHLPLTCRQIFYRLVGAHSYPKTAAAYDRLCEYLVRARRSGMVPFEAIRDDGMSVMSHGHYDGEEGFHAYVRRLGESYRQDKLASQGVDIRVLCEATGMMPQLARVLAPYSVPVRSCSGFDSLSAKHELLEWALQTELYEGKLPVVIHLGDYDPDGESIFESVREDVLAFMAEDDPDLAEKIERAHSFERVALTAEQVRRFELPTTPPKKSSSRTRGWSGEATCQLEALEPGVLATVVRDAVEEWLDLEILALDGEAEMTARRNIVRALAGGASSGGAP